MEKPGLYIHVPFCRRKCLYCAFFSVAAFDAGRVEDYRRALCHEARNQVVRYFGGERIPVATLYVGGGTPSILPVAFYASLFRALEDVFDFSALEEVSFEANPEHLGLDYLRDLRNYTPVRRISIGVQSFHDQDLKVLNRCHDAKDALAAVENARKAGFENLSVDLIYGLWGGEETALASWRENLSWIARLGLPHFSAYALSLEPGTLLWQKVEQGRYRMAPDEEVEREFFCLQEFAHRQGFEHYEISNLAKPGFESLHNSNYWRDLPYLGLGASAHSYIGRERFWNTSRLPDYLQDTEAGKGREFLSEEDNYHEYVMTALRTLRGVEPERLERFSPALQAAFGRQAALECNRGNLVIENGMYRIPDSKRLLTDGIASEFF